MKIHNHVKFYSKSSNRLQIVNNIFLSYNVAILIFIRENRYILFLTENYAALNILKNPKFLSFNKESITFSDSQSYQPFILFGSSFPKDKEYTQVFEWFRYNF